MYATLDARWMDHVTNEIPDCHRVRNCRIYYEHVQFRFFLGDGLKKPHVFTKISAA